MASKQLTAVLDPGSPDDGNTGRRKRGLAIAALVPIKKHCSGYRVPSQSPEGGHYMVNLDGDDPRCTCPDFALRQKPCKHIIAVVLTVYRESGVETPGTVSELEADDPETEETAEAKTPARPTYGQDWKSYYRAQEHEGQYFPLLLHEMCNSVIQPEYDYGRPKLPISDMLFCIARKEYSGLSRRRVMSVIRDDHEKGLISCLPSSGSLTKYIDDPHLTQILKAVGTGERKASRRDRDQARRGQHRFLDPGLRPVV